MLSLLVAYKPHPRSSDDRSTSIADCSADASRQLLIGHRRARRRSLLLFRIRRRCRTVLLCTASRQITPLHARQGCLLRVLSEARRWRCATQSGERKDYEPGLEWEGKKNSLPSSPSLSGQIT